MDNFPEAVNPHVKQRALFASYGNVGCVDVREDMGGVKVISQRQFPEGRDYLCAVTTTRPLLPPNEVEDVTWDPCGGEVRRKRQDFESFKNSLMACRKYLSRSKERKKKVNLLHTLLRGSGDHAEHITSLLEDDLPKVHSLVLEHGHKLNQDPYVPLVNSAFTGGIVSYQSLSTEYDQPTGILLHPRGAGVDTLTCTILNVGAEDVTVMSTEEVETCPGRILQVESAKVGSVCYCAVRTNRGHCSLLRADAADAVVKWQSVHTHKWTGASPTSIYPSPYIPGESAIATDKGEVYLWSLDNRLDKVLCDLKPHVTSYDNWWSAHFAAHPRHLVVANQTGMTLHDIRSPSVAGKKLFVLPQPLLHERERLVAVRTHPKNGFYHMAATDYSLLLMDHRFLSHPVLHFPHMFHTPPQYLDIACDVSMGEDSTSCDIVLAASHLPPETCCFQFQLAVQTSTPPTWISHPWKLSRASDLMYMIKKPEVGVSPVIAEQRLDTSLAGVCPVVHPNIPGLTAIQATAHGDIFYQKYEPSDHRNRDVTLGAGPGSDKITVPTEIESSFIQWLQEAQAQSKVEMEHCQQSNVECVIYDRPAIALSGQMYSHVLCELCQPETEWKKQRRKQAADNVDVGQHTCEGCCNSLQEAQQLKQAILKGELVKSEHEEVPLDDIFELPDLGADGAVRDQLLVLMWRKKTVNQKLLEKVMEKREEEKETWRKIKRAKREYRIGTAHGEDEEDDGSLDELLSENDSSTLNSRNPGESVHSSQSSQTPSDEENDSAAAHPKNQRQNKATSKDLTLREASISSELKHLSVHEKTQSNPDTSHQATRVVSLPILSSGETLPTSTLSGPMSFLSLSSPSGSRKTPKKLNMKSSTMGF